MSFRITTSISDGEITISLEGRLTAEGVADLRKEFQQAKVPVRIDLSGLISAGPEGIRELRELAAKGAELSGASPYIRQLLDGTHS